MKVRVRDDTSTNMKRQVLVTAMFVCGCFQAPSEGDGGGISGRDDAGAVLFDGGVVADAGEIADAGEVRCHAYERYDGVRYCSEIPAQVVCGGVDCAEGQECCLTTQTCVGPTDPCPVLPTHSTNQPTPKPCAVNSQCASDELCMPEDETCGGPSHCWRVDACAFCSAPGTPNCEVCGCNGVTYPSVQHACLAGVTVIANGACGVTACAKDAQCPADSFCCLGAGRCMPSSESWRCGTGLNCTTDEECRPQGQGGGPGSSVPAFCRHDGCGTARGACTHVRPDECGGAVNQVCGCDGVSYVNSCWAHAAGTNVASTGACP